MRLFIADPGLRAHLGHHANGCRHIVEAARARGIEVHVLAHVDVEEALRTGLGAQPFFRAYTYIFTDGDPYCGWLNGFYKAAAATSEDLGRLTDIRRDDIVMFHGAQPAQFMAALDWAQGFSKERCPLILVELATEPGVNVEVRDARTVIHVPNPQIDGRPTLFRFAAQNMDRLGERPFHVVTYDAGVSRVYTQLLGRPVGELPFPTPPDTQLRNRAGARPVTVAVLGHQQDRKGYQHVPELIARLFKREKAVRFLIHNSDADQKQSAGRNLMYETQERLRRLAAVDPRVVVREGAVDFDEWAGLLEACDLLLCPYDPVRYANGHSGLASMAIANAIPLVVPGRTPLAKWADEFGGVGTSFDTFEVDAILAALRHVLSNFDMYANRAFAAASQWAEVHGPENFLSAVLDLNGRRSGGTTGRRRPAPPEKARRPERTPAAMSGRSMRRTMASHDAGAPPRPYDAAPVSPLHHNTEGIRLAAHGEVEAALREFDAALRQWPTFAEAWFYRGMALEPLNRWAEAYDSYAQAVMLLPSYAEAEARLAALGPGLNRPAAVLTPWVRDPAPRLSARVRRKLREWSGGRDSFKYRQDGGDEPVARGALMQEPDSSERAAALGRALSTQGRIFEAELFFRYALRLEPWNGDAAVWLCWELEKQPPKLSEIKKVVVSTLEAGSTDSRLAPLALWGDLSIGQWEDYDELHSRTMASFRTEPSSITPLALLHVTPAASSHKDCAAAFFDVMSEGVRPGTIRPASHDGRKLTIGYLSADFRNHAVAQLCAELFELHDRKRVRVLGLSTLASDGTEMARRIRGAFDRLIDLAGVPVDDRARHIEEAEVDILVDLTGHTFNAQPRILAARPAPIQVNYLGYPGTLGTPAVDYAIVDSVVAPLGHESWFSEALVRMPGAYQVNDRRKPRGTRTFSRTELGLPEAGVIFCCFNELRKILPGTFEVWMNILKRVPESVLWLFSHHAEAIDNVRRAAVRLGVDPHRIVFAGRMDHDAHLSRYRVADVFLDTSPYNAHTTASDALWIGCPVVAFLGESFAGRVAASLLTAVGAPELIARSLTDYEELAVRLGNDRRERLQVREKLERTAKHSSLFDAPRFARQLEWAYGEMWRRHVKGEKPESFQVPENLP